MYYGTVQELVFHIDKDEGTPGSITLFLLATNTFSSFLLAWIWTFIGPILLSQKKAKTDYNSNTTNSSKNSNQADDISSSSSSSSSLNHPLIILTSITYLLAMAASNESLHYVSYPNVCVGKKFKINPNNDCGMGS
jgi:hypothetical protein